MRISHSVSVLSPGFDANVVAAANKSKPNERIVVTVFPFSVRDFCNGTTLTHQMACRLLGVVTQSVPLACSKYGG